MSRRSLGRTVPSSEALGDHQICKKFPFATTMPGNPNACSLLFPVPIKAMVIPYDD